MRPMPSKPKGGPAILSLKRHSSDGDCKRSEPLRHGPPSAKLRTLLKEISSAGKVSLDDLREAFPSTAEIFWQRFSVGRGEGPHIEYPTERSISNERPLIRLSQGEAVCPSFGELLLAVLEVSERCLGEGSHRASFFRARDKTLEDEARKPLESLLGGTGTLHANLFETPNHHHEHDLVVMSDDLCLIVEMKASPPPEPFRDPDKAFVRLRQAFGQTPGFRGRMNKDSEFGVASEQGKRLHSTTSEGRSPLRFPQQRFAIRIASVLLETTRPTRGGSSSPPR